MRVKLKEIATMINAFLEDTWTDAEFKNGKELDVPASWRGKVQMILPEYRKVGWEVTRRVEILSDCPGTPRDYITFRPPKPFKTQPKEIRRTGIRF